MAGRRIKLEFSERFEFLPCNSGMTKCARVSWVRSQKTKGETRQKWVGPGQNVKIKCKINVK